MKRVILLMLMVFSVKGFSREEIRERGSLKAVAGRGVIAETRFHLDKLGALDSKGDIKLITSRGRRDLLKENTRIEGDGRSYIIKTFISKGEIEALLKEEVDIESFNRGFVFEVSYPFITDGVPQRLKGYFLYKPEDPVELRWENKNLDILTNLAPEESFAMDDIKILTIENIGRYSHLKKMVNISIKGRQREGRELKFNVERTYGERRINPKGEGGESFGEVDLSYELVQEGRELALYFSHSGKAPKKPGRYEHIEVIEVTFR
ncbi:hypothetical protein PM10SUCC1_08570 [Propionigenium maris DSM 9537]|uniref:Uncharacterized protein n=1 Tax=Propionigenium maris DSM 9537 TaxID=1123000 RepID=A0A9W6GHI6_9FUSO|nr:hypothetical protein [Propionigenium maris]GLI55343.1 hypothetical protein PM10SUCC1_08570 [Propionigenium maris DSM 9537]